MFGLFSEMDRVSTGTKVLDSALNGGYESGVISTIYGPAGSGKTTLCLLCIANISKGKKIIYIDTENGFSVERLSQITESYKEILSRVLFLRPNDFEEQKKCIKKLSGIINDKIGIIIFDTIAMLYRLELKDEGIYQVNRELGSQVSSLSRCAMEHKIPVIIINQVYSDFEDKTKTHIVGGDIVRYGSKCLIELQISQNNYRKFIVRKHRSIPEEMCVMFKIINTGIEEIKESKGFKLF